MLAKTAIRPVMPANRVFDRISRELDTLSHMAEMLQGDVNTLIEQVPSPDISMLERFQALDLLTQATTDLSTFFTALSELTPDSHDLRLEEAAETLMLLDLARRLKSEGIETVDTEASTSGDCDFF